jgi:hypothetical protein
MPGLMMSCSSYRGVVFNVAVGNVGRADDAYCDVGGVLNDLAVAKVSSIPSYASGSKVQCGDPEWCGW